LLELQLNKQGNMLEELQAEETFKLLNVCKH